MHSNDQLNLTLQNPAFLVQDKNSWNISNLEWEFGDFKVDSFDFNLSNGVFRRFTFEV